MAIVDPRVPLPMVSVMIAALLANTRIDVLFSVPPYSTMQLFFTAGEELAIAPPPEALINGTSFVQWLARQGYGSIERFPMIDSMQLVGWFVLARTEGYLDTTRRAIATELANAFVLRQLALKREHELRITREALGEAEARLEAIEQIRPQQHAYGDHRACAAPTRGCARAAAR
jgi:hypothetical protein